MKLSSVRIEVEGPNGKAKRSIAVRSDLLSNPRDPRLRAASDAVAQRIVDMFAEAYAEANPMPPADTGAKPAAG